MQLPDQEIGDVMFLVTFQDDVFCLRMLFQSRVEDVFFDLFVRAQLSVTRSAARGAS